MAKKLRVAFVGGLSDKKLRQKLLPLTQLESVASLDVFRRSPPPPMPKVSWVRLPAGTGLGEPAKLARLLTQGWRYDLLIGCFQLYHGFWAHLAGKLWRRPVVQLVIDNIARNMEQAPARLAVLGASACGVRGPLTLAELRATGYRKPAAIIHNPFALPPRVATTGEHRFDFIAVGNFNPWKDYPWMVRVLAALAARGARPRLALGGTFPEAFKTQLRDILGNRAHFLGHLGPKELEAAYANSRALLMTSSIEGLPMVAVEAMSHGLPVVATAVGDLPWLVRHGVDGLLVPHGDTVAMAETLAGLLADPTRLTDMGAAARSRVEQVAEEFAPERIALAWQGLFQELGLPV